MSALPKTNPTTAPRPAETLKLAVPMPASKARKRRFPLISFAILVLLPLAVAAAYLEVRAAAQFDSWSGFSVRQEEAPSPVDLFGGFAGMSGSSSSDTDILYAYIQSQELVQELDAALGLRGIFGVVHARDPVFGFNPNGTIEDLVEYWRRMTRITYDPATGLIEMRVRAFDPVTAQRIAEEVVARSTALINTLSDAARADATSYAAEELELARKDLRDARDALTDFRVSTQVVDPTADLQGQMGLLASLEEKLAEELIRLDLLEDQTQSNDPRIDRSRTTIAVIEARIAGEREKLGAVGSDAADYASILAEYERLVVEQTFAEETYTAARAAWSTARAEARRKTRYLAAHIRPTLAERPTAPDPFVILGLGAFFLCLIWAILQLAVASIRDRRAT